MKHVLESFVWVCLKMGWHTPKGQFYFGKYAYVHIWDNDKLSTMITLGFGDSNCQTNPIFTCPVVPDTFGTRCWSIVLSNVAGQRGWLWPTSSHLWEQNQKSVNMINIIKYSFITTYYTYNMHACIIVYIIVKQYNIFYTSWECELESTSVMIH